MPFMSDDLSAFPEEVLNKLVFTDFGWMKCSQMLSVLVLQKIKTRPELSSDAVVKFVQKIYTPRYI